MEKLYSHGDCLLWATDSIPKGAKAIKGSVVHYGNTGNHHKLVSGSFKIKEKDGKRFVIVDKATKLVHEEHKAIALPKGKYALEFVQERDHFLGLTRAVVD